MSLNKSLINKSGDVLLFLIPINVLFLVSNKVKFIKKLTISLLSSQIFKKITKIPRPNDSTPENIVDDKSFYSGHTTATALSAFFLYYNKNHNKSFYSKFLILLSIFVGYSRIYSKAHRFEDVLTALLISKNLAIVQ